MHVFIIAALSADGFIAKDSRHAASWTSKEDKKFFVDRTKAAGVVIMGRTTFETIKKPLPGRKNIIYSRKNIVVPDALVTHEDPRALLGQLEEQGHKEVVIIGGAQIYTLFMSRGLVDTLYLTIEPILFGSGISLFGQPLAASLILNASTSLGGSTILNEYKVVHS